MRPLRLAAFAWAASAAACAAAAPTPGAPTPPPAATSAFAAADAATALSESGGVDAAGDGPPNAPATVTTGPADASAAPGEPEPAAGGGACNEQPPQDFLVRSNFLKGGQEAIRRAIQYRTDTYGYFKGFGRAPADPQPPSSYVVTTQFMGLPVKMHRKVVPALRCVDDEIRRACADHRYTPHALAGIRFKNTYRGGEVTNHIYGIAIDIDPGQNTCCGCVPPWNDAPACKRPAKTEYDRMAMPECWVHAFERYGFYWLGHDVLRDTMHFEFLGDPDRIVKNPDGGT
jgi:hypothetical protein